MTPALSTVHFCDEHRAKVADAPLQQLVLRFLTRTPAWVRRALRIRDRLVGWLGLKTSPAHDEPRVLVPGIRAGPFVILSVTDAEIIAGDDDKHLDFRVHFSRAEPGPCLVIQTRVEFHSWLGRAYFVPVKIGHRWVVKSMLRNAQPA